jgi:hypothetical protein
MEAFGMRPALVPGDRSADVAAEAATLVVGRAVGGDHLSLAVVSIQL